MKTIKILLTLFLIPISLCICQGQIDSAAKKKMCDGLMRAAYIFEGKLISSKLYNVKTGEQTDDNYMYYLIEVHKIIKGDITKGTVEIVQWAPGGHYKNADGTIGTKLEPSDGEGGPPAQGLYFCWDAKAANKKDSNFTSSNTKALRFYDGIPVSNGKIGDDPFRVYFSTVANFYAYISANYGIKVDNK